jgi:hypothetical protein
MDGSVCREGKERIQMILHAWLVLNNTVKAEYKIKVALEKVFANKKAPFYAYKHI